MGKSARTGSRGGRRGLTVRVKTAGRRSSSSTRWLERQLNDPYVAEAKVKGYRSRAAFKLIELDDRFRFLKPGRRVVDLGAAPGGWSQIAAKRVHAGEKAGGMVVGINLLPVAPVAGVRFVQLDFLDPAAPSRLRELIGGEADVVASDMAAPATGHSRTDHLRVVALAEAALDFAEEVLAEDGVFLAKVLRGGSEKALLDRLKRRFREVRHVKPPASRADSAEIYVIGLGYRASVA